MRYFESLLKSCILVSCWLGGCGGNSSVSECVGTSGVGASSGLDASSSSGATGAASSTALSPYDIGCPEMAASLGCTATGWNDYRNVNILLVIERSSAMGEPHPSGNGLSKWNTMLWSLNAALTQVIAQSTGWAFEFNLGLELYPYPAAQVASDMTLACAVPSGNNLLAVKMGPAAAKLPEIYDSLGAQVTSGFSPTASALRQALTYYTSGDGLALTGIKRVLLLTSGSGNCNSTLSCGADQCSGAQNATCSNAQTCCGGTGCADDASVVSAISDLASAGIQTLVLSPTPSTALDRASLNAYAKAGGYPNNNGLGNELFYSIANTSASADLLQTLEMLLPQVVKSCDVPLQSAITDASRIRVLADCQEIYPASADAGDGGWVLDSSQSLPHIKLLGSSCSNITYFGAHRIDILVDCPGASQ